MIVVYCPDNESKITPRTLVPSEKVPEGAIWIDMQSPTEEEIRFIESETKVVLPTKKEIWKNHILNRLYIDEDIAYMNAALITKVESPYPATSPVTFVLTPRFLLTIHEIDPTSFRNFSQRLQKNVLSFSDPSFLLEGLLEEVIMRVAYNSEVVVDALDELSHNIFNAELSEEKRAKKNPKLMTDVLKRLGAVADLNSKINESLHSLIRLLVFFKEAISESTTLDKKIDILKADTSELVTQTAFLSDKITFQLDATLGMINVEQNMTIKIFSVVAVFFMPPTLVTGLYGMNFEHIPELRWIWGYPIALMLMTMCAIVPYLYFRRRGWL